MRVSHFPPSLAIHFGHTLRSMTPYNQARMALMECRKRVCDALLFVTAPSLCVATDNNKEKAAMLTAKWDDHCLPWSNTIITDLTKMVSLIQAEQGRQLSCM